MVIRGARRPGREAPVRLSGRRGAADLRRASSQQDKVQHILVRHEQGAVHAAEGYARSTGKVGCVLVTSGPGATNAVTGLTDALMRFDPDRLHHRPGADAPDRQRRLPGMRHGRHHAALHQAQLSGEAHRGSAARAARGVPHRRRAAGPGPVVVDIPKDIQFAKGVYSQAEGFPAHRLQAAGSRATSTRSSRRSS